MRLVWILFVFGISMAQHKKKSVSYPAEAEEPYDDSGLSSHRPGPRPGPQQPDERYDDTGLSSHRPGPRPGPGPELIPEPYDDSGLSSHRPGPRPGPQPVFPGPHPIEEPYDDSGLSSHRPGPRPGPQPVSPGPQPSRPPLIILSTSPPLVLPPLPPSPPPPPHPISPGLPPPPSPRPPSPFPPPPVSPIPPHPPSPFPPPPVSPIPQPLPPTIRPETQPGGVDIYEVMPAGEMAQVVGIDVQCAMTSMRVRISFDRPFNGVIYSKGFFADPLCHFVPWGSNLPEYEFEVTLDRCGTQFIDNMASGGTANLETILLVQNEQNVQEMWDMARRVQCTWQDHVDQSVSTGFQVDMLDTVSVAYSGDDVSAEMDIQVGRGPFAQRAEGLLKIGEPLTVVIYVFGSGDMDVHVRDCIAHDGDRANALQLTDEQGCIVKKKLMGAWQFTRETGTTGASVIAYANMQSFRFPDKTDVYMECGLDICKGQCPDSCPEYPLIDFRSPPRSKRSVDQQPKDAILVRALRIMDESVESNKTLLLMENNPFARPGEVCMSTVGFCLGLVILVAVTLIAMLSTIIFWFRIKTINRINSTPCTKLRW